MSAYYTLMTDLGVTGHTAGEAGVEVTFTHGLSITPSLLRARVYIHQPAITCTAPVIVCTIGTNIITLSMGVGTLTTCDLEVQQLHSIF